MTKHFFYSALAVTLTAFSFFSGQTTLSAGVLDLAIIQVNAVVQEEEINEALRGESLGKAAFGDRLQVKNPRFNGVPVLFSQTMGITPGANFANSTRVGGQRAEVEGSTRNNVLSAQISLSEGMEAALRRFSRTVYQGRGPLAAGDPLVIGIRQIDVRQPSTVKGRTRMVNSQTTVALVYQYRR